MSHHYVQQLAHIIWSTKDQQFLIPLSIREKLYAYLSGIIKSTEGKLYLAGGHNNHVHCLLSLPPTISLAAMVQFVKNNASKWIKYHESINLQFSWDPGYTAISVQHDRIDAVCSYIKNEEKRHVKINYQDELSEILKLQDIQYEAKYFPNSSYSKFLLHIVWSTKNRTSFLERSIRPALYQAMSDTVSQKGCVMHAIGGIEDHVHVLIEISKKIALSDLIKEIKIIASAWLSERGVPFNNDFGWQTGYGAFSISFSTLEIVKQYIAQQEEHHKKSSFDIEWGDFVLKKGLI